MHDDHTHEGETDMSDQAEEMLAFAFDSGQGFPIIEKQIGPQRMLRVLERMLEERENPHSGRTITDYELLRRISRCQGVELYFKHLFALRLAAPDGERFVDEIVRLMEKRRNGYLKSCLAAECLSGNVRSLRRLVDEHAQRFATDFSLRGKIVLSDDFVAEIRSDIRKCLRASPQTVWQRIIAGYLVFCCVPDWYAEHGKAALIRLAEIVDDMHTLLRLSGAFERRPLPRNPLRGGAERQFSLSLDLIERKRSARYAEEIAAHIARLRGAQAAARTRLRPPSHPPPARRGKRHAA